MGEIAFVPWNTAQLFGFDIGPKAFWMILSVLIINVLLIVCCYKEFKIAAFDPEMAIAIGIPVLVIHYVQMGMLSLTTVASFDSVGAVLVVAMLIVPPAAAYLLTNRLSSMLSSVRVSAGCQPYWDMAPPHGSTCQFQVRWLR